MMIALDVALLDFVKRHGASLRYDAPFSLLDPIGRGQCWVMARDPEAHVPRTLREYEGRGEAA